MCAFRECLLWSVTLTTVQCQRFVRSVAEPTGTMSRQSDMGAPFLSWTARERWYAQSCRADCCLVAAAELKVDCRSCLERDCLPRRRRAHSRPKKTGGPPFCPISLSPFSISLFPLGARLRVAIDASRWLSLKFAARAAPQAGRQDQLRWLASQEAQIRRVLARCDARSMWRRARNLAKAVSKGVLLVSSRVSSA